jgi:hypothetical protein
MTEITFKPRIKPRNLSDGLLSLAIALFLTLVILGDPGFIAFLITGSKAFGLGAAGADYLVFASFSVSKLIVMPEGIRLARFMGYPELIPWSSIESIQEAPRLDLFGAAGDHMLQMLILALRRYSIADRSLKRTGRKSGSVSRKSRKECVRFGPGGELRPPCCHESFDIRECLTPPSSVGRHKTNSEIIHAQQ